MTFKKSWKARFKTVVADPPWPEYGGGKIKRGSDRHYTLMKIPEIEALPVKDIVAPDAHLYLWVTNNYLQDGLAVMAAWGFRYVTTITWVKDGKPGLGQYYRGQTEHCLFGVRGKPGYRTLANGKRAQGGTVIFEPRGLHSVKPDILQTWAENVSPGPRIELFARRARKGWTQWGHEAPEK